MFSLVEEAHTESPAVDQVGDVKVDRTVNLLALRHKFVMSGLKLRDPKPNSSIDQTIKLD